MVRSAVFGGAVALVGYENGIQEMRSSDDVGRATTVAVVAASLAVIVLDFVMLFVASF
jgi:ABC-type transporter Mla maintaining outer membrane lipid asymmetry permease subunit MlaE